MNWKGAIALSAGVALGAAIFFFATYEELPVEPLNDIEEADATPINIE